jgi:hypothetical protein
LNYAAQAYHGGLNACPTPGYYTGHTVDVDAQNAYPTAMGAVLDPDFCPGNGLGVVEEVWKDRQLTLADVPDPAVPITAYVRWSFPDDVVYPCIPVLADSTILYPRSSEGINGCVRDGPRAVAGAGARSHGVLLDGLQGPRARRTHRRAVPGAAPRRGPVDHRSQPGQASFREEVVGGDDTKERRELASTARLLRTSASTPGGMLWHK